MKKDELIQLVRQGHLSLFYGHVAECTDCFDYKDLDDIISALDNSQEIDLFCQAACDEFDVYLNSRKLRKMIMKRNKKGETHGLLYKGSINTVLQKLAAKALQRKQIELNCSTPMTTAASSDNHMKHECMLIHSVGTLQVTNQDIINNLMLQDNDKDHN